MKVRKALGIFESVSGAIYLGTQQNSHSSCHYAAL